MKTQKRCTTKRILSWMMALVMVCSIMTGVTMSSPTYVAEAATSQYTTPITEKAEAEEAKVWNFAFVIPKEVKSKTATGAALTTSDVTNFNTYIAKNFETVLEDYSMGNMDVQTTVVSVDTLSLEKDSKGGYYPAAAAVEEVLSAVSTDTVSTATYGAITLVGGNKQAAYDHVFVCYQSKVDEDSSIKTSTKFKDSERMDSSNTGYSFINVVNELGLNEENRAWLAKNFVVDEKVVYYDCTKELVHGFMHDLVSWIKDYYPSVVSRSMPSPDKASTYYNVKADGYDEMNNFYKDFFRGNVPVKKGSTKTWGMTVEDYGRGPGYYQTYTIAGWSVDSLDAWNELCTAVTLGATVASTTKVYFNKNINAAGQEIATLPEIAGELNGNGYAIIGAKFTENGLIETIKEGTSVRDLLLINASLTNKKAKEPLGLLAGTNYGVIGRCGVTGSISGSKSQYVGGLVGKNGTSGKLSACFNGATVAGSTGTGAAAGGLAGWTEGEIKDSYNYGVLTGKTTYSIAGVAEANKSKIDNCYTLAGCMKTDDGNTGTVTEKTQADLAAQAILAAIEKEYIDQFEMGNAFPTIKDAKYDFMTPGGSTKALADAEAEADVTIWAGGKSTKLTTSMVATKWLNAKKEVKTGSITWIVKNEPTKIEFDTAKHKVTTTSDKDIATVSKGTVKGKTAGKVYVYAIDTGSMTAEVFVVEVKAAPTAVATYYNADDKSKITSNTLKYTSDTVPEGQTAKIYYVGTTGSAKKGDWKVVEDDELTYTLTVPTKYKDYITVTEDTEKDYFDVTVKEGAIAALNPKKLKAFTVSLSIKNDQTGKKTTFKVVVSNPVKEVTLEKGADTTKAEMKDGYFEVTMGASATASHSALETKETALIKETTKLYNESGKRTDSTKIVRIPHPSQYDFSATGAITLVGKTSAAQNKVSLKAENGGYTVTAAAGTPLGTEAYFIIWHNSFGRTNGVGYQIVKVTVGEANHVDSLTFKKTEGSNINKEVILAREGGTFDYTVKMPATTSKTKQEAYLTETVTLDDAKKVTTDGSAIYKLPCATGSAFTIAKNGVVTVNGALSAAQKKVSMAAVGSTGEYKITAAKGTPEGTEAYFLLYHNPEVYSIISVTVGTPNKVTKSVLTKADGTAELKTENGMTVVTVKKSTSSQIIKLTETVTLPKEDTATTDVTKVLRMATANGYEVALNEGSVTAKGTLTKAQKKISMTLKDKTTNTFEFDLKVNANTPAETETYFIIYHNNEGATSGTGYHIVKVLVTE